MCQRGNPLISGDNRSREDQWTGSFRPHMAAFTLGAREDAEQAVSRPACSVVVSHGPVLSDIELLWRLTRRLEPLQWFCAGLTTL